MLGMSPESWILQCFQQEQSTDGLARETHWFEGQSILVGNGFYVADWSTPVVCVCRKKQMVRVLGICRKKMGSMAVWELFNALQVAGGFRSASPAVNAESTNQVDWAVDCGWTGRQDLQDRCLVCICLHQGWPSFQTVVSYLLHQGLERLQEAEEAEDRKSSADGRNMPKGSERQFQKQRATSPTRLQPKIF